MTLAILAGVFVWEAIVTRMSSSLWLDELGTHWVIDGSAADVVERAAQYHGQTPLYYLAVWLVTRLFGTSELVLRAPSVVAIAGAVWLTARLAGRLFGRTAVLPAAAILMVLPNVAISATDARPYALGLLAVAASTYALYEWVDRPTYPAAVLYGVSAALVVYVHYVLAAAVIGHVVALLGIVVARGGNERTELLRHAGVAGVVAVGMVVPTLPQVVALFERTEELVSPLQLSPLRFLFEGIAGYVVIPVVAAALLLGRARPAASAPARSGSADAWWIAAGGAVTPIVVLLGLGTVTDVVLWQHRYTLAGLPSLALLVAGLVAWLVSDRRARRLVVAIGLLAGFLALPRPAHRGQDWRAALATAEQITTDGTQVLLASGFVESSQESFVSNPDNRSYLNSPAAYYWPESDPDPMPYGYPVEGLDARVARHLDIRSDTSQVVYVGVNRSGVDLGEALTGILEAEGFGRFEPRVFGSVFVIEFRRPAS